MNEVWLTRLENFGEKALSILSLMNQPTSWGAYASLALGLGFTNAQYTRFSLVAAGICSIIAIFRNDNSGNKGQ